MGYGDTAIAAAETYTQDPFLSTYAGSARHNNAKGTWTLTETTDSWKLVADTTAPKFVTDGGHKQGVAISSFPHNQLGADFQFNVRTLHEFGHGFKDAISSEANKADSYFWYAVDTITITFPHHVSATDSCHGIRSGYVADPDTVDCTGHVHDIIVDENIEVSANQGSPIARLSAKTARSIAVRPLSSATSCQPTMNSPSD